MVEGFEFFSELAGDADAAAGCEFAENFEGGWQAVGRLEEEGGFSRVEGSLELLATLSFFDVKETVKGKRMGGESGGDQGRGDGGGAGENGEFDTLITTGFQETVSRVRQAGGSGVGNNCDVLTFPGTCNEVGNPLLFVVVVKRNQGAGDFEVIEELKGVTGVLAGDEVSVPQRVDRPKGNVPQIADGGGDEGDHGVLDTVCESSHDAGGGALEGVGKGARSGSLEVVVNEEAGLATSFSGFENRSRLGGVDQLV